MTATFPPRIGAPATRALTTAGIKDASDLAQWTKTDLLSLHGMGPKAVRLLQDYMHEQGFVFPAGDAPPPSPEATGGAEPSAGTKAVDAYLRQCPSPQQATLTTLRATLRSILPHADEGINYGLPSLALDGKGVAGYGAYKSHCAYVPTSGTVLETAADVIAGFEVSKGAIRFAADKPLPPALLRHLVKLRLAEISDVANGKRVDYYRDGQRKAVGTVKAGVLHGNWEWFRQDGSLMRSGRFTNGEPSGTWTTWIRDGTAAKVTQF